MRIFVEAQSALGERAGIGQYARSLVEQAVRLDKKNHYTLFAFCFGLKKFKSPIKGASYRLVRWLPSKGYAFLRTYLRLWLPIDILLRSSPDLYFYPTFVAFPVLINRPRVIVVHDLSFVHFPQFVKARIVKRYNRDLPISLKAASKVIAVSDFTKKDLIRTYDVPANKIAVIPPGVDHNHFYPRSQLEINNLKKRYKLPKSYILFLGTLEPRKNVTGLLKAYAQLPSQLKRKYGLVIAGSTGWRNQAATDLLNSLIDDKENITRVEYVPTDDLPILYSGATCLAHVAHLEGFGIPLVEAMACGTPVIAGNNSAMPKVVGKAGLLVNVLSVDQITQAMIRVLTEQPLRQTMIARGIVQAKKFNWQASALKLIKIFNAVGRSN